MEKIVSLAMLLSMAHASIVALVPPISQYHSQDSLGQYSFGYSGGPSSQHELRTLDGITQGSYAYIDANNVLQTVSYVSDPVNGFRVAATNLPHQQQPAYIAPAVIPAIAQPEHKPEIAESTTPIPEPEPEPTTEEIQEDENKPIEANDVPHIPEDTEEVKAARAAHLKAHELAKAAAALSRRRRSAILAPLTYIYTQPIVSHQYGIQNDIGQYAYGYSDNLSAKQESRALDGTTTGGYSYIDANGQLQVVNYIADDHGFRVLATNLPQAPKHNIIAAPAPAIVLPVAPEETPEVKAARKAHLEAHEEVKKRESN